MFPRNLFRKPVRFITVILLLGFFLWWISIQPSLNRDWTVDQAVLPQTEIDGNILKIQNVRHVVYRAVDDFDVQYEDRTYDMTQLKRAWYIVEPFSGIPGSAHTFLSFEFMPEGNDPEFIAISVEVRKEKGESYSPLKGLLKQYELIYVVADERDVIKLRTNYRKDDVFLYPVRATPENVQKLFLSMINRVNTLHDTPEFYNTIWNTCTTNIVRHINELSKGKVPFSYKVLFPDNSDKLAYDLGLIDTELPFEKIREHYHINELATKYADDLEFSERIREFGIQKRQ